MAFAVQAASDLDRWSPLTTVTNLTGTLEFKESEMGHPIRRFYRMLLK